MWTLNINFLIIENDIIRENYDYSIWKSNKFIEENSKIKNQLKIETFMKSIVILE